MKVLTIPPAAGNAYCAGWLAVMRRAHILPPFVNLDLFRSFISIAEHGSLNKAAERLRVSQSTLTRQMQALEHHIGGRLLERSPGGVALTATGHVVLDGIRPLLERVDRVVDEARMLARGQSASLRIGYLMSAAPEFLNPALATLRKEHPEVKVMLRDLSPGEQIEALRKGEIDVALTGNVGTFLSREFYVRRLAVLPVLVALAEQHPLAAGSSPVRLKDLREELFVGAPDKDLPGHNQWIVQLCRRAGFRPRFLQDVDSLVHGLATVVTEGAVAFTPGFAKETRVPGVVFRPLADASAKWDLVVAWQRGRIGVPVKALLEAFPKG
ncbi:LysR family transcriptional regulator [Opitutaceae bacterium TAV5]|nr:LysR family transcriptional regulator [Opitutaceae bacterium TAV5]